MTARLLVMAAFAVPVVISGHLVGESVEAGQWAYAGSRFGLFCVSLVLFVKATFMERQ